MKQERGMSSPDRRYNPRSLLDMTSSHKHFRGQMPGIVTDIADLTDNFAYSPVLVQMRERMQTLLSDGPAEVMDIIYGAYALGKEWTKERRLFNTKTMNPIFRPLPVLKPMQTLTEKQLTNWNWFRDNGEIAERRVAIDALSLGVLHHFNDLPIVAADSDPVLESIGTSLRQAPFQIVHRLLPDLTDAEAGILFPNTTAADVKQIAEEANRTDK